MISLSLGVNLVVGVFLGSLIVLVLYRMLTGKINTRYLFYGTMRDGTLYFSPERVQLMIFTLWVALSYFLDTYETQVVHLPPGQAPVLPDVPTHTLALMGASQMVYLAGKAYSMLIAKVTKGV